MTYLGLFEGIGGGSIAATLAEFEILATVEIDDYCNEVLKKNFPNVPKHKDIKDFSGVPFAGRTDIVFGGFPCQPFSTAGQRLGENDDRALWGEMFRVIQESRPAWVVGENVVGLVSMGLDAVLSDLEGAGYSCRTFIIPAVAKNALHRRERVWIIAYSESAKRERRKFSRTRRDGHSNPCGGACGLASNTNDLRQLQSERCVENEQRRAGYCREATTSDSQCSRCQVGGQGTCGAVAEQANQSGHFSGGHDWQNLWQPHDTADLLRVAYGIPEGMDGTGQLPTNAKKKKAGRSHRIKALGNSIVPQVLLEIFKAIKIADDTQN